MRESAAAIVELRRLGLRPVLLTGDNAQVANSVAREVGVEEVIADVLPWVGAFHLKFWDLEDSDGRVSAPIRDLGALLRGTEFAGTLCSEWGGHEWLDDDPTTITRNHLALARRALNGATA